MQAATQRNEAATGTLLTRGRSRSVPNRDGRLAAGVRRLAQGKGNRTLTILPPGAIIPVMSHAGAPEPDQLLLVLREQAGLDLAELVPADGGESASTFLAAAPNGGAARVSQGWRDSPAVMEVCRAAR